MQIFIISMIIMIVTMIIMAMLAGSVDLKKSCFRNFKGFVFSIIYSSQILNFQAIYFDIPPLFHQ